jgi:hypothetical protein
MLSLSAPCRYHHPCKHTNANSKITPDRTAELSTQSATSQAPFTKSRTPPRLPDSPLSKPSPLDSFHAQTVNRPNTLSADSGVGREPALPRSNHMEPTATQPHRHELLSSQWGPCKGSPSSPPAGPIRQLQQQPRRAAQPSVAFEPVARSMQDSGNQVATNKQAHLDQDAPTSSSWHARYGQRRRVCPSLQSSDHANGHNSHSGTNAEPSNDAGDSLG